jgi:hypothetical protein
MTIPYGEHANDSCERIQTNIRHDLQTSFEAHQSQKYHIPRRMPHSSPSNAYSPGRVDAKPVFGKNAPKRPTEIVPR